MQNDFSTLLRSARVWIDHELNLWNKDKKQNDFSRAAFHVMGGAGKAFRPALCIWVAKNILEESFETKPSSDLMKTAFSLELMHSYSLVHDDLPCMDDDSFRRGRPTLHTLHGEAFAVLSGDAFLTETFACLAQAFEGQSDKLATALKILTKSTGAEGMIEGQWLDICSEKTNLQDFSKEELLNKLETIHDLKTGALLGAAVSLGALQVLSLSEFQQKASQYYEWGILLGRLFQMTDDYLDTQASSAALGKTSGKDAQQNKLSYPALLGTEGTVRAIESLKNKLASDGLWKNSKNRLDDLLHFVAHRGH